MVNIKELDALWGQQKRSAFFLPLGKTGKPCNSSTVSTEGHAHTGIRFNFAFEFGWGKTRSGSRRKEIGTKFPGEGGSSGENVVLTGAIFTVTGDE